jgi:hypothetical protein
MQRTLFLLGFIAIIVALDTGIAEVLSSLYTMTSTGESGGMINYALTRKDEVLILGSSRAKHHINPQIISEKLSMTVFNAGINGHDFLFAAMFMDLWKQHNPAPRVLIVHVDSGSFVKNEVELQKTKIFSLYIDQSQFVRRIILGSGPFEPLKYLSRSYRFNGKVLPIIKGQFVRPDARYNGYEGLNGIMPPPVARAEALDSFSAKSTSARAEPFWTLKLDCLENLISYCNQNGTLLILVHSPIFDENPAENAMWSDKLQRVIANRQGVYFINIADFLYPAAFSHRNDLYYDKSHLNAKGAGVFTSLLADRLLDCLEIQQQKTDLHCMTAPKR